MPSFKLLPESEREALIDFVIYLSVRGEVERALYEELALELEEGERLIDDQNLADGRELLLDILAGIVGKWQQADTQVAPVPPRPDWNDEEQLVSIRRGRELFYGAVANCVKCHGESQLGDGEQTDYDDWTKSFHDWTQPTDAETLAELKAEYRRLGGLKPRNIIPRNLREGIYRGGRRPIDLYWRIVNGIDGAPMPAAMVKAEGADPASKALTPTDVWNIIDYVMSLPYENMQSTGPDEPIYVRPRQ
jgi:mono/diheme cytochrome c family protein